MKYKNTLAFSRSLDQSDPLKKFRSQFYIPKINGRPSIYFTGNSLGLQPKSTSRFIDTELKDWANYGVEGHFHATWPWLHYHKFSKKTLAKIVGAKPTEVVSMNQLTINLHLMLISFYRPVGKRVKILAEAGAFSSDQYAFESQVRLHGIEPQEGLIELKPRQGEHTLRIEDILEVIKERGDEIALVVLGAVQYYSGQFFDINKISTAVHKAGGLVGFDLAHAIGNVPLQLHRDQVDFAVWCSYKYLNSGPGGVGGAFIHERHSSDTLPRLAGWWGHDAHERFKMKKGFKPMSGVDGWQVSNYPVISGAAHLASLEIFEAVDMTALRKKSVLLTGYLEFLLSEIHLDTMEVITPTDANERGCQLSILMKKNGRRVFNYLCEHGVIADWREPDVIRVAPAPLYNTFEEVFRFAQIFAQALK